MKLCRLAYFVKTTQLYRKYITENYPDLKTEGDAFKKALEAGERKGQLDRITGKYVFRILIIYSPTHPLYFLVFSILAKVKI